MVRRVPRWPLALLGALTGLAVATSAAAFTYHPPGALTPGSGQGLATSTVHAPGMRFPIENAPAYLNSQVWGAGGMHGPGGGQCASANYSYPWRDNYCESRPHAMPLCPSGTGHQGQDMRPATCQDNVHWAVAVESGTISHIGVYSVSLQGASGIRHRYLHLRKSSLQVAVGQHVQRGQRIGRVSNEFGGTPTTIHLHFDMRKHVAGYGNVYVSPYMSLVRAYEALIGPCTPRCDGHHLIGTDCNPGNCGAFGLTCVHPPGQPPQCGEPCTPRCEGSVMVAADCTQGDCGAFGAGCAMQGGQPTCVTCTPRCDGHHIIGTDCSAGNCGAFGLTCVQPPGQVPQCGQGCTPHCDGAVMVGADCSQGNCGAFGAICVMEGGQPTCKLPCTPHCEGNLIVDGACGVGDCGAFGATCKLVNQGGNLVPQCVVGCHPHCQGHVIISDDCGQGDCGAFGLTCVVNGHDPTPQCGQAPPCQHRCEGTRIVYNDCAQGDCGAFGLTCADYGLGPQCVLPACEPGCDGTVIVSDACQRGDCGVFGLTCSTAGGGPPRCVSELCTSPDAVPVVHEICHAGQRYRCRADGLPELLDPQPVEVCNGQDDDCNGLIDDGVTNACGECGPEPVERCNGLDDNCDGQTDEGFDVGAPCTVGQGECAVPGVRVCAPDGLSAECAPLTSPCDDGDPCTDDACRPDHTCAHTPVPACCAGGGPCPEGLVCRSGRCVAPLCAPCSDDGDCPGDGRCVPYELDAGCGTPCEGAGDCPEGFVCAPTGGDGGGDGAVCVADAEWCDCGEVGGARCAGATLVATDGCGTPTAVLEVCGAGCADGACVGEVEGPDAGPIGDGDGAEDAAAPPDAGEVPGDADAADEDAAHEDAAQDASPGDASPGDPTPGEDAHAQDTVGPEDDDASDAPPAAVSPGRSASRGCGASPGAPGGAWWLALLAVALLHGSARRRRGGHPCRARAAVWSGRGLGRGRRRDTRAGGGEAEW